MPFYTQDTFDRPIFSSEDVKPTFGQSLEASISSAWQDSYLSTYLSHEEARLSNYGNKLNKQDTEAYIKNSGLSEDSLKIDGDKYTPQALDVLINRKKNQLQSQIVSDRTPYSLIGTPIRAVASLGAGLADPINLAAAFFPAGKLAQAIKWGWAAEGLENLAVRAATNPSLLQRSLARYGTGFVEGAVGTAALEPVYSTWKNELGDDYKMVDNLVNIGMGGAFGGALHAGGGAIGDAIKAFRNKINVKSEVKEPGTIQPIDKLATDENGYVADTQENQNLVNKYMSQFSDAELANYIDNNGNPTALGQQKIRDGIINKAFDNDIISAEINRPNTRLSREVSQALAKVSPIIEDARNTNSNFNNLDISADLVRAINNDTSTPEAQAIHNALDTINKIDFLAKYYSEIKNNPNTDKMTVIDAALKSQHPAPSLKENMGNTLGALDDLYTSKARPSQLINMVSPDTREGALKFSVGQFAGDKPVNVSDIINSDPVIGLASKDDMVKSLEQNSQPLSGRDEDIQFHKDITQAEQEKTFTADEEDITNLPLYEQATNNLKAEIDNLQAAIEKDFPLYSRSDKPIEKIEGPLYEHKVKLQESLNRYFGKKAINQLVGTNRFEIVNSIKDLPKFYKEHPNDVKAMYDRARDKTYFVAENITPDEAQGLMLHEVGVHAGMERMLGTKVFKNVLSQVERLVREDDNLANYARAQVPLDTPEAHINEEILAHMIENAPQLSVSQKILSTVRAWAYKNFEFARNKLELTDGDLLQLAKASLRKYTREGRRETKNVPEFLYSRNLDQDRIDAFRAEMAAYDKVLETTGLYGAALRDSLGSARDKTAFINAIHTSIPRLMTLSKAEELANKYNRRAITFEREILEGRINIPNADPRELAVNSIVADETREVYLKKRNAIFNYSSKNYARNLIGKEFAGQEVEGFKALCVGSNFARVGARDGASTKQELFTRKYLGGLDAAIEGLGHHDLWTSGAQEDDIMRAVWGLGTGSDISNIPPEFIAIAKEIKKTYHSTVVDRNARGASIIETRDYLMNNGYTFNQMKILELGKDQFIQDMSQALNFDEMAKRQDITPEQARNELSKIYDDFAKGSHMKYTENKLGDIPEEQFNVGPNISNRLAKSRVLIFKDADSFIDTFKKYSGISYREAVYKTLLKAGKEAGLLDKFGPSYELNLKTVINEVADNIADPTRADDFRRHATSYMRNAIPVLDGTADILGQNTIARVGQGIRSVERMALMGGSWFTAFGDVANSASELKFQGGAGYLSNVPALMSRMLSSTKNATERNAMMKAWGIYSNNMLTGVASRNGDDCKIGNFLSKAEDTFHKWSLLEPWTHKMHLIHGDILANQLGEMTVHDFNALPDTLQTSLKQFNIMPGDWELLRGMEKKAADGNLYLDPMQIESIRPAVEKEIAKTIPGLTERESKIAVDRKLNELQNNMLNYYIQSIARSTAEPGARTRIALKGGTERGTIFGEISQMLLMFKTFPTSVLQNIVSREVYSRGFDSFKDFLVKGGSARLGLAQYLVGLIPFAYASMVAKDLMKGRTPRDPTDPKTWLAAMAQGGGLGIYGDFLFGDANRFGGGMIASLAGPVAGDIEKIWEIYKDSVNSVVEDKPADVGAKLFNFTIGHVPGINLFYTRFALDYLMLYNIQERMNPGYLNRMENRIEKQNNQTFWLPPSQNALQY